MEIYSYVSICPFFGTKILGSAARHRASLDLEHLDVGVYVSSDFGRILEARRWMQWKVGRIYDYIRLNLDKGFGDGYVM